MAGFMAVLSPAKLMDETTHYVDLPHTSILFPAEAEKLVQYMRKYNAQKITELMDVSEEIATDTVRRFRDWKRPTDPDKAIQAMLLFRGEVYRGLSAGDFNLKELQYAQDHIRILSGLYGVLRPLDLILPYRLMMGTAIAPDKTSKNLYAYWTDKVSQQLHAELGKNNFLLDLASSEYFKVIDRKKYLFRVISCDFLEKKGKDFRQLATYSKLARGKMARFLVKNQIRKTTDIRAFAEDNYQFNPGLSTDDRYIFTRG